MHAPETARAAASAFPRPLRAGCASLRTEDVAVVVIFDGREKMSPTMFGDFYADGAVLPPSAREQMTSALREAAAARGGGARPADSPVRDLHLFELPFSPERSLGESYGVTLNLLLAVKERNAGKLNSHVFYFRTFCPLLQPRYCFLLDAGTVPDKLALLHLYADLESNGNIGGIAGEICVETEQQSCFAPVIGVQLFEYATANLLDKSMESMFGFIGVLPGAFSAYRYEAVFGRPLDVYFSLEDRGAADLSPAMANAYLAEDRLLGFEIVAKEGCRWTLHYCHAAQAFTDVPDTIGKLVRQRRRWGNGSLFAQVLALSEWHRLLYETRHGVLRKAGFALLWLYYVLSMVLSLFVIGNAYFAYALLFQMLSDYFTSVGASNSAFGAIFASLMWVYEITLATLFVYSLGNRPDESESVWQICVNILALFNTVATGLLIYLLYKAVQLSWQLWTAGLTTFGAIFVCAALQGRFGWVITSTPAFFWLSPMLLLVIPIYSLCNLQDVSWGTREAHASAAAEADAKKREMRFREFRSLIVLAWIMANLVLTQLLLMLSGGITGTDSAVPVAADGLGIGANGTVPAAAPVPAGVAATNMLGISTGTQRSIILYYICAIAGACAFLLGMRIIGCLSYVALAFVKRYGCAGTHCCRKPASPYTTPATCAIVPMRTRSLRSDGGGGSKDSTGPYVVQSPSIDVPPARRPSARLRDTSVPSSNSALAAAGLPHGEQAGAISAGATATSREGSLSPSAPPSRLESREEYEAREDVRAYRRAQAEYAAYLVKLRVYQKGRDRAIKAEKAQRARAARGDHGRLQGGDEHGDENASTASSATSYSRASGASFAEGDSVVGPYTDLDDNAVAQAAGSSGSASSSLGPLAEEPESPDANLAASDRAISFAESLDAGSGVTTSASSSPPAPLPASAGALLGYAAKWSPAASSSQRDAAAAAAAAADSKAAARRAAAAGVAAAVTAAAAVAGGVNDVEAFDYASPMVVPSSASLASMRTQSGGRVPMTLANARRPVISADYLP